MSGLHFRIMLENHSESAQPACVATVDVNEARRVGLDAVDLAVRVARAVDDACDSDATSIRLAWRVYR